MVFSGTKTAAAPPSVAPAPTAVVFARGWFPLVAILLFSSFLITGFGTNLGPWRPVPVYIFFGFLLFLLQANLIETRSVAGVAYAAFATVFALLFAADVVFNTSGTWHFSRAPLTYIIINALLLVVLGYNVVARRMRPRRNAAFGSGAVSSRAAMLSPMTLAVDFAELAILSYVAATLVNLLRAGNPPYLVINLNQALGLHLPARIAYLQDLDAAIALSATAVTLLLLGIVGGVASNQAGADPKATTVSNFEVVLRRITQTTLQGVSQSLRLVLGPLIYVSFGLSIAYLSQQIAEFFQQAQQSSEVFDLLNPFSPTSQSRYSQGLLTVLLTGIAVVTIIVSVALVEQNVTVIRRAIALISLAGQTAALTLAFFMFSLAFLNAVLIFVGLTKVEPFQVSAPAILALLVGGLFAVFSSVRESRRSAAS